jgi:HSP20 family protein
MLTCPERFREFIHSSQQEVRIMTMTRRPSPFGELLSLRLALDRLFEDSFVRPMGWGNGSFEAGLPVDVTTTTDELVVEAQLPGIKPEDVDITIENGTLQIRAEIASDRQDGEGDYLVREIRRGTVSRTIGLPNGLQADKADATFENGVLKLRIPKAEEVKPRQIRITPGNGSQSDQRTLSASSEPKA